MHIPANYSADVQLTLVMENQTYSLSKIGENEVVLRQPISLPQGDAEVVMKIDGREHRWGVRLVNGAFPFDAKVETKRR
ncbi:MAG: hypothetical protein U0903_09740 [Planctomycetales bacterium]